MDLTLNSGILEKMKTIPLQERAEYGLFWFLEHVSGKNTVDTFFKAKKEDLNKRILSHASRDKQKGKTVQIERIKGITPSEFRDTYLKWGIPVVMEGAAADWDCVKKWTPRFLAEKYGDDRVSLIDASPDNIKKINYVPEETTLRDVILSMDTEPIKKYSRFNRILHEHPELKDDFDMKWLSAMRNPVCSGKTFQVFIGGKGSKTHIHCASEHNIFTQVYGRKHWIIYPPEYDCAIQPELTRTPYFHTAFDPDRPDFEKYPAMEYLDRMECILEAGDVLFNPPSYWHHVTNLSGSIGVGFRWFSPDCFRIDFMQALLTMLSVNPPFWLAGIHRTDFPKIFSYMNDKKKS